MEGFKSRIQEARKLAARTDPEHCFFLYVVYYSVCAGEFGNLIAGDERSSPRVQLHLLHSKVEI